MGEKKPGHSLGKRIKVKSAVVSLLLVIAMILGQVSMVLTSSFAAPGQVVTVYEDANFKKWLDSGVAAYCIEKNKPFGSGETASAMYERLYQEAIDAGLPPPTKDQIIVSASKRWMETNWGPLTLEDKIRLTIAQLVKTPEEMTDYAWEFLRGGKADPAVDGHSFWRNPTFPTPDYSLDYVPEDTALHKTYGKYQMLFTKAAYSGEDSVATRTIVDSSNAGRTYELVSGTYPAGLTMTQSGNALTFDYRNPTKVDFSVDVKVTTEGGGDDFALYYGGVDEQIIFAGKAPLEKTYTIWFHID
ncbi:MAG: hypothetical protein LBQ33_01795, partial [Oscillospiraceae bacterium]|nr:hypothetical protein [Oscillospiraceae bacterium]